MSCNANFSLSFTGALAKADPTAMGLLMTAGLLVDGKPVVGAAQAFAGRKSYTVQPEAGGAGDVYGMDGETALAIRAWAQAAKASLPAPATPASGDASSQGPLAELRQACSRLEGGVQGKTPDHPGAVTSAEVGEWAGDALSAADGVPANALNDKDRRCIADAKQPSDAEAPPDTNDGSQETSGNQL